MGLNGIILFEIVKCTSIGFSNVKFAKLIWMIVIGAGIPSMVACKTGTTYLLTVLNWPWRSVTTNGLLLMRSASSDAICLYRIWCNSNTQFEFSTVIYRYFFFQLYNHDFLFGVYLHFHFLDIIQLRMIWQHNKRSMLHLVASIVKVIVKLFYIYKIIVITKNFNF